MYILNLVLPLASSISAGCFGFFIGKKGAMLLSTSFLFLTNLISFYIFFNVVLLSQFQYLTVGSWINSELFIVDWGFQFDTLSSLMFCVVSLVSLLVHLYSCSYMAQDPHVTRFMSYLSLFTFFMLVLVAADNLVLLFFGWEGVGLCSFLLINFWFTRIAANKAAIKAMVVNRIGDLGLLLGIIWVFEICHSVSFDIVFSLSSYLNTYVFYWGFIRINYISIGCFFLFVGSMGKSAQLSLHTWLPDAMEGPTPVSALIHAATMVTAGVFLIIRCSPLFEYAPSALSFIAFLGALTALFGATVGLVQNDVKKVVAYSTSSQLGYMIFACGLSNYSASFYHLINHAFFKAALFLASGALIHNFKNAQDMREMGQLGLKMPFTFFTMTIASLALAGLPFFSGSFSKDMILEVSYIQATSLSRLTFIFGILAAFCTAAYSIRLLYLVFLRDWTILSKGDKKYYSFSVYDVDNIVIIPLSILIFGSVFSGTFLKNIFELTQLDVFKHTIFISEQNFQPLSSGFIPSNIKWIPAATAFISIILTSLIYILKKRRYIHY